MPKGSGPSSSQATSGDTKLGSSSWAFARAISSGVMDLKRSSTVRPPDGTATGWSLYVSEFDLLWEKINMAPPASTLVDSSLGLDADLAGTLHPKYGRPRSIAALPRGSGLLISTSRSWVVRFDPASGAFLALAMLEFVFLGEG